MDPESMIEKVARALCRADRPSGNPDEMVSYSDQGMEGRTDVSPKWTWYIGEARAAIAALREPTWRMVSAAHPAARNLSWSLNSNPDQDNIAVWHCMIDATLKETP